MAGSSMQSTYHSYVRPFVSHNFAFWTKVNISSSDGFNAFFYTLVSTDTGVRIVLHMLVCVFSFIRWARMIVRLYDMITELLHIILIGDVFQY